MTLLDTTVLPFGLALGQPGHADGQPRPRDVVPPPVPRRRVAAVRPARAVDRLGAGASPAGRSSPPTDASSSASSRRAWRGSAGDARAPRGRCRRLAVGARAGGRVRRRRRRRRRRTTPAPVTPPRRPAPRRRAGPSTAPAATGAPRRRPRPPTTAATHRPPHRPRRRRRDRADGDGRRPGGLAHARSARSTAPSTWPGGPATTRSYVVEQDGHDRARRRRRARRPCSTSPTSPSGEQRAGPARPGVRPDRRPRLHQLHRHRRQHGRSPSTPSTPTARSATATRPGSCWTIDQPYANHNGGDLVVRPRRDALHRHGRRRRRRRPRAAGHRPRPTLLGKMLRIDPTPSGGQPYTVPPDNPFVGDAGAAPGDLGERAAQPVAVLVRPGDRRPVDRRRRPERHRGDRRRAGHRRRRRRQGPELRLERVRGQRAATTTTSRPTAHTPPFTTYTHDPGCSVSGGVRARGGAVPDARRLVRLRRLLRRRGLGPRGRSARARR